MQSKPENGFFLMKSILLHLKLFKEKSHTFCLDNEVSGAFTLRHIINAFLERERKDDFLVVFFAWRKFAIDVNVLFHTLVNKHHKLTHAQNSRECSLIAHLLQIYLWYIMLWGSGVYRRKDRRKLNVFVSKERVFLFCFIY